MQITITVPDEKETEILDAFAAQYKYKEKVEDSKGKEIDNPITKKEFALGIINTFIKNVYVASKVNDMESQRLQVMATAKDDVKDVSVE